MYVCTHTPESQGGLEYRVVPTPGPAGGADKQPGTHRPRKANHSTLGPGGPAGAGTASGPGPLPEPPGPSTAELQATPGTPTSKP